MQTSRGFFETLIGDGRPLLNLTALCLGLAGGFAIFQSATGHFLPHDISFLQMTPQDLCGINECRIVHFMFHDRVSFGGALIGIAVFYLWLSEFPLKSGESWAWWTLCASGLTGFGSFLSYLGYGYLDEWHAVATVGLLPCFVGGLSLSRKTCLPKPEAGQSLQAVNFSTRPVGLKTWTSRSGIGRLCLLATAIGLMGAGIVILIIGMTQVFVLSDLTYMGISRPELDEINPRLIPLIAHDRAGFGGAVATLGLLLFSSVWHHAGSPAFRQALIVIGLVGWTSAIGIHPIIGYTDPLHLAPPIVGASLYFAGCVLITSRKEAVIENGS